MANTTLAGTPQLVDSYLAPVVRILAGLFGGLGSAIVAFLAGAWWAPLPLAGALLGTEAWLWSRGDRAQRLTLTGRTLVLEDPLGDGITVDLDAVTNATAFVRPLAEGVEVAVVLGDDEDVRFAFRLLQQASPALEHHIVRADAMDVLFGGIAGVYRALAPAERRARQTFEDPSGDFWATFRRAVPDAVWRRTGLRLWPGMEPEIDLFGFYRPVHSDWMVLDGHDWKRDGATGSVQGFQMTTSEREVVLFQGLDKQQVQRVPLSLVNLGVDTTIAFPAPAVAEDERQPLTEDLLHTHAPEAAALVWHLLTHTPRDRRPAALRRMIEERRDFEGDLDGMLPG